VTATKWRHGDKPASMCIVEGCETKAKARHLCSKHLDRLRIHGSVDYPGKPRIDNLKGTITPEIRVEVIKAMSRFEKPITIANRLGISNTSVFKIMSDSRKP
jgi:hypothetical protein